MLEIYILSLLFFNFMCDGENYCPQSRTVIGNYNGIAVLFKAKILLIVFNVHKTVDMLIELHERHLLTQP